MFKRVSGTKDILPQKEITAWLNIEETFRRVFAIYNYQEIRTPILEEAGLFNRSLGNSSEIVRKQMFILKTEEDEYALRPEGTAAIVRAYLENNLDKTFGFSKFYYIGPMFRFERPQKGRLRQFHHLGVEVVGSVDPGVDIEVISLADSLLKNASLKEPAYKIKLNSLGCLKDKEKLSEEWRGILKAKLEGLCQDCKVRFKTNVLRVLDCKNAACKDIVSKIGLSDSHLCHDCRGHFNEVRRGLELLKVKYEFSPTLVRGLDYYTRTVFEITHPALGAQDALCAGGRYDNLVKELGGPELGAMGFAFGMERLLLVSGCQGARVPGEDLVYLITLGEEAKTKGLELLDNLRRSGVVCDTDYENKSLKGAMRKAHDLEAKFVLIIGEDELKKNVVMLKDMGSGKQREVRQEDLIKELKC